jgi:hypothetical protein
METDYQQLCDFFQKSCPKERVSDTRLLNALWSAFQGVRQYENLLQVVGNLKTASSVLAPPSHVSPDSVF